MKILLVIMFVASIASSCKKSSPEYSPEYSDSLHKTSKPKVVVAIHPLHNSIRIQEMYGPIINILNREIPEADFYLESSKDYGEYNEKIKSKRIDILLPNPYQTIIAQKYEYNVFAKMSDDENFRGLVLVRKDSKIKKISDLKFKTISFPAPTALAASMMPQHYLETHGVLVSKKEVQIKYVGSQESSILAVYHKEVDAAATWPMTWNSFSAEKPELKKDLQILFLTDKLINNSLMARNNFPIKILEKVKRVFLNLHMTEEGKHILRKNMLSKFDQASNDTYKIVDNFLENYKLKFGELPQ